MPDDLEQETAGFLLFELLGRARLRRLARFEDVIVEKSKPPFLSANVQGSITTDSEEPFRRRIIRLPALTALELDECFLYHVARALAITDDPGGVLQ